MTTTQTETIRQLNDRLRVNYDGGRVMLTIGIHSLPQADLEAIVTQVREFNAFTPDNDPHGEHDFGAFDHNGTKVFWKIAYYDLKGEYHSPDAANPRVTMRVLTIMLASEY